MITQPIQQLFSPRPHYRDKTCCSVIGERLNSRLRNYLTLHHQLYGQYLEPLNCFFNHCTFPHSRLPERVRKSPLQLLTDKVHPHWLTMLGFGPLQPQRSSIGRRPSCVPIDVSLIPVGGMATTVLLENGHFLNTPRQAIESDQADRQNCQTDEAVPLQPSEQTERISEPWLWRAWGGLRDGVRLQRTEVMR